MARIVNLPAFTGLARRHVVRAGLFPELAVLAMSALVNVGRGLSIPYVILRGSWRNCVNIKIIIENTLNFVSVLQKIHLTEP